MNFKQFIPLKFFKFYADFKNRNQSPEEIFTRIYQKNYWGNSTKGEQFFSGDGTTDLAAEQYKETLINFIEENAIKSIFEIGCGDFTIMKSVLESTPQTQYYGVDVVKELINHLNQKYQTLNIRFSQADAIATTSFPSADLCIIRQVLQHLSNQQILEILEKTKVFKYVMITEHIPLNPQVINANKSTGGYIRLQNKAISGVYLDRPPFNQAIKTLLSYPQNDKNYDGKIVPAIMQTVLIENDIKA